MPQCDNKPEKVTAEWREELGEEWECVWETYHHTLGNLTLTGYNSEYSNRNFRTPDLLDFVVIPEYAAIASQVWLSAQSKTLTIIAEHVVSRSG